MTTRLSKPVRRIVRIGSVDYVVELDAAAIRFRPLGRRHWDEAPLRSALQMAERLTGLEALRARRVDRAIARAQSAGR